MIGNKLRAWMEAVRPKKKQNKKDKPPKGGPSNSKWKNDQRNVPSDIIRVQEDERRDVVVKFAMKGQTTLQSGSAGISKTGNSHCRYSANNLSSPESAYSTGYSTDGTSPGAPPDYLLSNRSTEMRYYPIESENNYVKPVPMPLSPCITRTINPIGPKPTTVITLSPAHFKDRRTPSLSMIQDGEEARTIEAQARNTIRLCGTKTSVGMGGNVSATVSPNFGLDSSRQRDKDWVKTIGRCVNGYHMQTNSKPDIPKMVATSPKPGTPLLSPRTISRFRSPSLRRRSLSLSSSSTPSCESIDKGWETRRIRSIGSDEDTTLNEMMGKYDESYVYEKETDILSDSDPTDCDTDIDTGQDGGDEEDTHGEGELDFIDNGSYIVEFEPRPDRNTGHCSYYSNDLPGRKASSRRRNTRRNKSASDKRRRSSSNKKRHKHHDRGGHMQLQVDGGSKSAGATPVSVRRSGNKPVSKLVLEDGLKKRSNSVCFSRDPLSTIDKRDKEADLKYRELIGEAEQILKTMKSNGLSPRRLPAGPANKRVELLRSSECTEMPRAAAAAAADEASPIVSNANANYSSTKSPSNNFSCPRFSPKKNHITNFIISNSPIMIRREWENQHSPLPLVVKKKVEPVLFDHSISQKSENRRSPKYRKKNQKKYRNSSSSEEDNGRISRNSFSRMDNWTLGCPQSEPLRRKVYSGYPLYNCGHEPAIHGKTVTFNLNPNEYNQNSKMFLHPNTNDYRAQSSENLRQQVLLNTIASLKRNLENQSASLKQVYKSSQNVRF
ncbi:unnamed protein product [Brassicogethes aeneus]|uniref:Uncharacterized protein n=1 Tax=Brassicogethes aeneus TaxID=1431903 RepID=A0A9P0BFY1_BRAAE|nr:unnamed protein product [Brassicogethes aeneus]